MAVNLAKLVVRLQIETSKYVEDLNRGKRSIKGFTDGLKQTFAASTLIPSPAVFKELDRKLSEIQKTGPILRRAVNRGIRPALTEAKATVPVDSGLTRKSLRVKTVVSRDKKAAAALLGVSPVAFYALQFVELGKSNTPAKPWLQPAFEDTADEQIEAATAELKAGIEKAAR